MIPVTYSKPLLQSGVYIVADYDRAWLEYVLREAAAEAGVQLPCAAEVACNYPHRSQHNSQQF